MQNNNDHMGGYVSYFTDMPATNGYPNTVVFPRDDEMTVVCQGPVRRRASRPPGDRHVARRQAHAHHAELCVGALHQGLRSRACRQGARALRQRTIGFVGIYQMSLRWATYMKRFPQARFCRRQRDGRPRQGDQERGGDGAGQARRDHAGRRDARRLRRDQARHARHRSRGGRAALQPVPWQRERHLSLRLDAARQAAKFANRHVQNRTIQKGDQIALLVEDNGPGGMYTELGRSCVVGAKCRRR